MRTDTTWNTLACRESTCVAVDASARWQAHYAQILKEHGFVQGLSNPSLFVHVERDIRLLVHGDDFMVEMPTHEEKWFGSVSFSKYDGKCTEKFHSGGNTAMEASFLNRVIRRDPTSGWAGLETDTRHVAMVLRDLGLEKSTPVVTLVDKRPKSEERLLLAGAKPLNAEYTKLYKSITMCVNNLSLDRPHLSFAARSLARGMKGPTRKDLEELKRVGRYLRGRQVGAIVFEPQTLLGVMEVFGDADLAGDLGNSQVPFWNGTHVE